MHSLCLLSNCAETEVNRWFLSGITPRSSKLFINLCRMCCIRRRLNSVKDFYFHACWTGNWTQFQHTTAKLKSIENFSSWDGWQTGWQQNVEVICKQVKIQAYSVILSSRTHGENGSREGGPGRWKPGKEQTDQTDRNLFSLQNCLNSSCHSFNKVLETFLRDVGPYWHVGVTQFLQICQLLIPDVNPPRPKGHWCTGNPFSCSTNQFEMMWALWHVALSCWKKPPDDGDTGHKGMEMVSINTQVGCSI